MPALIVDPDLLAAVTRQFNLRGTLEPFNLTENVVPIFDIGRLIGITQIQKVTTPDSATAVRVGLVAGQHLLVGETAHSTGDVISSIDASPTDTTVLADTGQVTGGVHRIEGYYGQDTGAKETADLVWRNAANSADLATWRFCGLGVTLRFATFFVTMATNERFIWRQVGNSAGSVATTITIRSVTASAA